MQQTAKDGRCRKCSVCSLNTTNVSGTCDACSERKQFVPRWYAVVMSPSKLRCTFLRKGEACMCEAVAVQHGRHGMTGKAACKACVLSLHIEVHMGKDAGGVGHYSGVARANPPETGRGYHKPLRHRQLDPFEMQVRATNYVPEANRRQIEPIRGHAA